MKFNGTNQTKGEFRVRTDFNVSEGETASQIDKLKAMGARFIDAIDEITVNTRHQGEMSRLKALAQTNIETATMYAVKAATLPVDSSLEQRAESDPEPVMDAGPGQLETCPAEADR